MIRHKTGVALESFRLGIKGGIKAASALGFKGIQIDTVQGEITPEKISQTGRRELKRMISSQRLYLCALGGGFGAGFVNENEFDFIIKKIIKIINLARDLETDIVTIQAGSIQAETDSKDLLSVRTALDEIGRHAENYGCRLAAMVSYKNHSMLKDFLKSLNTEGIKLIYDPASLMTNNLDPIKGIHELHKFIVHTKLWDTRQTEQGGNIEVPIGEGIIPVEGFASTLESAGYNGFYVVNSKTTQQPFENIKKSKEFLDRF